jgi:hypothetical protein
LVLSLRKADPRWRAFRIQWSPRATPVDRKNLPPLDGSKSGSLKSGSVCRHAFFIVTFSMSLYCTRNCTGS